MRISCERKCFGVTGRSPAVLTFPPRRAVSLRQNPRAGRLCPQHPPLPYFPGPGSRGPPSKPAQTALPSSAPHSPPQPGAPPPRLPALRWKGPSSSALWCEFIWGHSLDLALAVGGSRAGSEAAWAVSAPPEVPSKPGTQGQEQGGPLVSSAGQQEASKAAGVQALSCCRRGVGSRHGLRPRRLRDPRGPGVRAPGRRAGGVVGGDVPSAGEAVWTVASGKGQAAGVRTGQPELGPPPPCSRQQPGAQPLRRERGARLLPPADPGAEPEGGRGGAGAAAPGPGRRDPGGLR